MARHTPPYIGNLRRVTVLVLCQAMSCECARAGDAPGAQPGTRHASIKIVYPDPLSGRPTWRMTTDGTRHGAENITGDLSSEATSWSPDSQRIVYGKRDHPDKPDGVYQLDLQSGVETFLAPTTAGAGAVYSRSSDEVFYAWAPEPLKSRAPWTELRAVDLQTFAVRTVARFEQAIHMGPVIQNRDGSLLAVSPLLGDPARTFNEWSEQTVVMSPAGEVHPNWTYDPARFRAGNADFAMWSPLDPRILLTRRFLSAAATQTHFWNVDSLERPFSRSLGISHASWHPDGRGFLRNDYFDLASGKPLHRAALGYAAHPHINPADAARGLDARLTFDVRSPPLLMVATIRELPLRSGDTAHARGLHYSTQDSYRAHPHPHWSPDGRYILWQSDVGATDLGAPPGGSGTSSGGIDLFVAPLDP